MDFGFLSLLPPLVAIVLAVATRRVVLPLAAGVAVGAVVLAFGRVELVTDFGTNDGVRVRFAAPSPWVSGCKTRLVLLRRDNGDELPSVMSPQFFSDNEPYLDSLEIFLNSNATSESTVQDLLDALENSNSRAQSVATASLEKGEPSTPIAASLPSNLEILEFEPEWKFLQGSGISSPAAAWWNAVVIFVTTIYESMSSVSHIQALIFSLLLGDEERLSTEGVGERSNLQCRYQRET